MASPPHVTVTILPVDLSLVHIPRSRVKELSHPILGLLLRENPKFLNLTANEIELSIFSEDDQLVEFEPIARRDRQRQHTRDRVYEQFTRSSLITGGCRHVRPPLTSEDLHPIEISLEKWKVLQIDSHEDPLSNSGSRVRELSAPLAAAGISILYQSSYMSDFIFVKATRLNEVIQLFDASGFSFYDPSHAMSLSSFGSPHSEHFGSNSIVHDAVIGFGTGIPGSPASVSLQNFAVLSRTRSPSMTSLNALSLAMSRSNTLDDLRSAAAGIKTAQNSQNGGSSTTSPSARTPKKSMSPTAAPVAVLTPDLACIGLTDSEASAWTTKIMRLVAYPEQILFHSSSWRSTNVSTDRSSTPIDSPYRQSSSHPRVRLASPGLLSCDVESDNALEDGIPLKDTFPRVSRSRVPRGDPSSQDVSSPISTSPGWSSEDDEEYYSDSIFRGRRPAADSSSTPSLVSATSNSSTRSLPEHLEMYCKDRKRMALSPIDTTANSYSQRPLSSPSLDLDDFRARSHARDAGDSRSHPIPFFSFTRTGEGSSLTTDLRVLATLFKGEERNMVIYQGDLLELGDELIDRAREDDGLFEMHEPGDEVQGVMKCLQIDLQKYGLDKYGLVNRFSRILEEDGINHMYSSTFKCANLLVDKALAVRAQSLLRSC